MGEGERGRQQQSQLGKVFLGDRFCSLGEAGRKGGDSVSAEDKEFRVVSTREDTTEEYSFDALAKGLASGTISRRKALKLVGTAILGGGLLAFGPTREAEAAECGSRHGCDRRCRNRRRCRCVRTVTGNVRCVRRICCGRGCSTNGDCGNNALCMTENCCGAGNECVPICGEPRPGYCDAGTFTATQEWDEAA